MLNIINLVNGYSVYPISAPHTQVQFCRLSIVWVSDTGSVLLWFLSPSYTLLFLSFSIYSKLNLKYFNKEYSIFQLFGDIWGRGLSHFGPTHSGPVLSCVGCFRVEVAVEVFDRESFTKFIILDNKKMKALDKVIFQVLLL